MRAIRWATSAAEDLSEAADFLAQDSPSAAQRFVERVDHAVRQLSAYPTSGRVVSELDRHNITRYREIVISPWRLFYRHEPNTVYIIAIIDGRRDVHDVLLRRLTRPKG